LSTLCINCRRPPEDHKPGVIQGYPVSLCPYGRTGYQTMSLPAGQTCRDCQHFSLFCSAFIGPEIIDNDHCDWYPIRFVPKLSQLAAQPDKQSPPGLGRSHYALIFAAALEVAGHKWGNLVSEQYHAERMAAMDRLRETLNQLSGTVSKETPDIQKKPPRAE
jgi:hypothetical protein